MSLTLNEICERLKSLGEVDLLELLNINSEDIVERFKDIIEDNADQLEREIE
jgi:hypothetical protein